MLKRSSKIFRLGIFLFLSGLALALVGILLQTEQTEATLPFYRALHQLMVSVGLAILSLGILGVIVNLRNWQNYFMERMADVIMKKDYLSTLEHGELVSLQTSTLGAMFGSDNLDRDDSLLSHYQNELQHYLGGPYREDGRLTITILSNKNEEVIVRESWGYICRTGGDSIQSKLMWEPRPASIRKVQNIEFRLYEPAYPFVRNTKNPDAPSPDTRPGQLLDCIDNDKLNNTRQEHTYFVDLNKYADKDGLRVETSVEYTQPRRLFISSTMAFPTKGFTLTINYDSSQDIEYEVLGIDVNNVTTTKDKGILIIRCHGWVLPDSGVVVQLRDPLRDNPVQHLEATTTEVLQPDGRNLNTATSD